MWPTEIEKLTPEQEALIPVYREKWKAILFSTERIDRQKATEAVKAFYVTGDWPEPEILFFDNPYAAYKAAESQSARQLESQQYYNMSTQLVSSYLAYVMQYQAYSQQYYNLSAQLFSPLFTELQYQLEGSLWSQLINQLECQLIGRQLFQLIRSELLESQQNSQLMMELNCLLIEQTECQGYCPLFDFCISVLNCVHEQRQWPAFQSLVSECGGIFLHEKTCLVCDRPIKFSFDSENRLHAEGEPAIQFADGYSLYSYHGVTLPEKYGKLHPREWQAQWLLEENNAERRRVLIQGIGYARICQELNATELDYWQEYTLLEIDEGVDVEPIYLLKMTCPSTGFIHALRVPPNIQSAREAIRWVNWGTDPDEFAIQT